MGTKRAARSKWKQPLDPLRKLEQQWVGQWDSTDIIRYYRDTRYGREDRSSHIGPDQVAKIKDEKLLAEARRLLRQVESKPLSVHVRALLLYEIGNILLLKTNLDSDELEKAIDELEALPFIVAPPATPLLQCAARVGRQFTLTFYDASFLALPSSWIAH